MPIKLPKSELALLAQQIEQCYVTAQQDHRHRIDRFVHYYRMWRNRVATEEPKDDESPISSLRIPVLQWHAFGRVAKIIEGLFGEDARIRAAAIGPSDEKAQKKAEAYINWRFFSSMRAMTPLAVMIFRMVVFGRSFAYSPWRQETFVRIDQATGRRERVVSYEGPGLEPLFPDDFIVPAEDVESVQQFSWTIQKLWLTPQQLLDGERAGKYFGITENFEQILNYATGRRQRDYDGDEMKREKDQADGVTMDYAQSSTGKLLVYRWCGRRRLPKGNAEHVAENDFSRREMDESELLVHLLVDMKQVIGVEDLVELYPLAANRRPYVEMSLTKDGSYWCPGFGELLENLEEELTVNSQLMSEGGMYTVGPLIFYRPGSGMKPETFRYRPFEMVPTDQPNEVNVVRFQSDLSYCITREQQLSVLAERVTGESEYSQGRSAISPNQPRTATGQMAMMEAGNIRVAMDLRFVREDLKAILKHIWELDQQFAPPNLFFRVTEAEAAGLFDTKRGGAEMTPEEFNGSYDFDIQFATSIWQRDAQAQKELQLYGLDMQNPLILQNPRALWKITNKVHAALGDRNFASLVPEPPDTGETINPKEEWALMLQGEEVDPRPADNDDFHIITHLKHIEMERASQHPDEAAIREGIAHVAKHHAQKRQKMLMQALTQQIVQNATQAANQAVTPIEQLLAVHQAGGKGISLTAPNQQPQPAQGRSGA
jgi:hypothetical protein